MILGHDDVSRIIMVVTPFLVSVIWDMPFCKKKSCKKHNSWLCGFRQEDFFTFSLYKLM